MSRKLSRRAGPPPWQTLEIGEVVDRGVFGLQQIARRSPRTGHHGVYQVLRIADWANVIALTPKDEVVLVAQYRHGIDRVTLEIPGGVLEPGETPARGIARELVEETGYTGAEPVLIGTVHPNPAIQDNACTTWLVTSAEQTQEPAPDAGEDIDVLTAPRREIPELLRHGRITHSLVVAAFYWLDLYTSAGRPLPPPAP